MTWPVNNITTTYLSSNSATILGARPEIYTVATSLSDVINARGEAEGVASLDVSGKIPVTELPPTHRSYGGIHLTLDSGSGKVIIQDYIHLTPFTQTELNAKTPLNLGDIAVTTNGNGGLPGISYYDGTQWQSTVNSASIGPKVAFYDPDITSSSPVFFTIPSNITKVKITAVGAGGGGAGALSADGVATSIGGTGGAGSVVVAWITNLTTSDTIEVYCGIGGDGGIAGGTGSVRNGQNGENTTIVITKADSSVQTITAAGGVGGTFNASGAGTHGAGGQGAVTNIAANKHIIIDGNPGTSIISGATQYGPYVVASTTNATGINAVQYGSGGGNGRDTAQVGFNGGYGSNGLVTIEY